MGKKCFTSAVVGLAAVALCCVAAGSAMATTPTLTHEWNFDGNLNDSVGTKNADALGTGTAISTTTKVAGSGAAQFDGINDLLYVQGMDAIPAGAFTISFWEYCTDPNNQGYFVSDAATHPEYQNENFNFRRRTNYATGTGETSIRPFGEIGAANVYYTGWMHTNGYWDTRWPDYAVTHYGDSRQFPVLPTGEWVHHVITNYQPATNDAGWTEWYVNGQMAARNAVGCDPFTGLQPLETDPIIDPQDPFYFPNRREGFVIGNLIDNTNIDNYNENYSDNPRVGPTGNYHGYIDSFQVYNGTVTPDQVRYLHDNPSANLTTYTAPSPSTQPKTAHLYRWKFDGNLNEEGGSGYNATALGGATVGTTGGVSGGAMRFDADNLHDNDAVTINKNVLPAGAFSVVFWEKEEQVGDGKLDVSMLVDGANQGRLRMLSGFFAGPTPDPRNIRVYGADLTTQNYTLLLGQDGQAVRTTWAYNVWRQHALIVTADGDMKRYINGQLTDETPSFPFDGLIGDLWMGNSPDFGRDLKGWIDDLQIYNWAINADDVAWLWANSGQALTITGGVPVYQPYDVNEDGFVGADDLDVVRAHWGESGPGGKAIGDINLDEFVGADDLDQLRAHWGEVCPPVPGLVPEPSTFVLLLMGALAIIAVRRVR